MLYTWTGLGLGLRVWGSGLGSRVRVGDRVGVYFTDLNAAHLVGLESGLRVQGSGFRVKVRVRV